MLFGVMAAAIGLGTAAVVYFRKVQQKAALDAEKNIDTIADYCQTKVEQLEDLLNGLPRTTAKATPAP